ncbi:MAG TPA: hypothetical protein VEF04_18880 [Blastocatellia bacterium]|nr:hypothetical protein [Blastocatellia bacterium]
MRILIFAVCLYSLAHFGNTKVYGCECIEKKLKQFYDLPNLIEKMEVVVFSGRVIQQVKSGDKDKTLIKFQVYDSWKNATSHELSVIAQPDSNSCGYDFKTGKAYLVVAYRVGDKYETSLCTPTRELSRSKKLMQELDRIVQKKRIRTSHK